MRGTLHLIRNATIAALVGSTAGGVVGLWTVRDRAAIAVEAKTVGGVVASSPTPAPSEVTSGAPRSDVTARDQPARAVATKADAGPAAGAIANGRGFLAAESQALLQRARTLAERPDVRGLVALREGISRRADAVGEQESQAVQQLLRDVDRYLEDARLRRLKLDGEALKKGQK